MQRGLSGHSDGTDGFGMPFGNGDTPPPARCVFRPDPDGVVLGPRDQPTSVRTDVQAEYDIRMTGDQPSVHRFNIVNTDEGRVGGQRNMTVRSIGLQGREVHAVDDLVVETDDLPGDPFGLEGSENDILIVVDRDDLLAFPAISAQSSKSVSTYNISYRQSC
jgi:hypothetical protein